MKSILIIGGSGILSSAVVDACLQNGYKVTMMNRGNNSAYTNNNAKLIICDARKEEQVKEKTKGLFFDVVIDFIVYNKSQLEKSLALFGHITHQYILISSAQVYNTNVEKELVETDETPQKIWTYSINKAVCEKYLKSYCQEHKINFTIVRPGVNYDNRRIPYGMCPPIGMHWTIVTRILAGKPIITWNNGENKLNLTRVEDFAFGFINLLGNTKAYNDCFNVVGNHVYTWKQVLDVLGKLLSVEVKTVDIPVLLYANELEPEEKEMLLGGRACDLVCSNAKLKSIAPAFHSSIELEEGLKMTLDWYYNNNCYQRVDYRWDADCDRIICKFANHQESVGYVNYLHSQGKERLVELCLYKAQFYKDNCVKRRFWKLIKKALGNISHHE